MFRNNLVAVTLFVVGAISLSQAAHATTAEISLTEEQLTQISTNCSQLKVQLDRLHSSDALLRVNRGQLYEHMGSRLMAPLNSRIAAARLDGAQLVAITSNYETNLESFRDNYSRYERKLSDTLKISCTQRPADFYSSLLESRASRSRVAESTNALSQDVAEYSKQFDVFKYNHAKEGSSK